MIVSGTAVVKSDNPAQVIKDLRNTVQKFIWTQSVSKIQLWTHTNNR